MNITAVTSKVAAGQRRLTVTVDEVLVISNDSDVNNIFASVEVAGYAKGATGKTVSHADVIKAVKGSGRYAASALKALADIGVK